MSSTETLPLSLSDHKRVEMSLLTDLEKLREFAQRLELARTQALLEEVVHRLKTSRFQLAVVGEFKRGKSTFINALLGQDILPSDILPCSATLNRVTYGLEPYVEVRFKDGREQRVEIDQLANYVTKLDPEAEDMAATVQEAVVHFPVAYCQNNVDLIDTPGLNDDAAMTDVTLSVLPQVDVAILVVMALSPFSEYERDFLENRLLTSDLGRVMFVVSAIDRLNSPQDADKVIRAVRDRISKYVVQRAQEQFGPGSPELELYLQKLGEPKVYGLSAYQALQARQQSDSELLKCSRFPQFEQELERFLAQERGALSLQIPVSRALSACDELERALALRRNSAGLPAQEFAQAYQAARQEIEKLRGLRQLEEGKIDQAAQALRQRVLPRVKGLSQAIELSVRQVIDAYSLQPEDTKPPRLARVTKDLSKKISAAVRKTSQLQAEEIQQQIQQALMQEAGRLQDFVGQLGQSLERLSAHFGAAQARPDPQSLTLLSNMGTMWGDSNATTVLGGISFLAFLGVGVAALPMVLGVLAASYLTGGWMKRNLEQELQRFRDQFYQASLEQLQAKLEIQRVEKEVSDYIESTFQALKAKVQAESSAVLDDTEKTLLELQTQRERAAILGEEEVRQLQSMGARIQTIRQSCQALCDQLSQLTGVRP